MRRELAPELPTCFTVGFSARDLAHDVVPDDVRFARAYAAERPVDYRESILEPNLAESLPRDRLAPRRTDRGSQPRCPRTTSAPRPTARSRCSSRAWAATRSSAATPGTVRPRSPVTSGVFHHRSSRRSSTPSSGFQGPGAQGSPDSAETPRNSSGSAALPFPGDYIGLLRYFDDDFASSALHRRPPSRGRGHSQRTSQSAEHLERAGDDHWLHQAMYLDLKTFLPALNLTYMDKMSMAHSIEVRVPLIDELVVDVVRRLPAAAKLTLRQSKIASQQAMRGVVPQSDHRSSKGRLRGAGTRVDRSRTRAPRRRPSLTRDIRRRGFFKPDAGRSPDCRLPDWSARHGPPDLAAARRSRSGSRSSSTPRHEFSGPGEPGCRVEGGSVARS